MRFVCTSCQREFTVAPATLAKFPKTHAKGTSCEFTLAPSGAEGVESKVCEEEPWRLEVMTCDHG